MKDVTQFNLEQSVQAVMNEWTQETIAELKSAIAAKDIELTGSLKQSLDFFLTADDSKVASKISMIFNEYGRFSDMRYRHKVPPTKAMYDFVQKVGLSNFKTVPGYQGFTPIGVSAATKSKKYNSEEYVMKRIANAIAYSRMNSNWQNKKVKEWWNITIKKRLGQLKAMIRTQLEQDLAEQIRTEFNLK